MKRTVKTLIAIILLFSAYAVFSITHAASASISASKTNVNVGESVNITVSMNAAAWNTNVSGAVSKNFAGNSDDGENMSKAETVTFTPTSAGTYTIYLGGDVSDGTDMKTSNVSGSVTITVSNSSSNSSSSNSNSGTNSSASTTQTTEKTPSFSSTNQTVYATGTVNVRSSYSTNSSVIGSLSEGDSVTRTGVGDNGWSKITYNGTTAYVSTTYLTDKKPEDKDEKEKSKDTALKTLEVTPKGLTPDFNSETTTYSLEVGSEVEKIEIKATPSNEKSKVSISGNDSLKAGDNTVKITVTAEDGTTKTYTINVKKQDKNTTIGLTSLKLSGYNLVPSFSSDIFEYKVNLSDGDTSKLDFSTIANEEGAKVEITGNDNLKVGENTITITVTSADGKNKATYKVYVTKSSQSTAPITTNSTGSTNKKSKLPLYIGIGLIVLLFIIMLIIIIRNRRNNEYYEEDYDEDENPEEQDAKDNYVEDLYGYSSKNFGMDDYKDNNGAEKNINTENINSANNYDYANVQNDKNEKFDYNPYSEINMNSETENKTENPYEGLFGTANGEYNDDNQANYGEDDYDYRPRRSKGKHSK